MSDYEASPLDDYEVLHMVSSSVASHHWRVWTLSRVTLAILVGFFIGSIVQAEPIWAMVLAVVIGLNLEWLRNTRREYVKTSQEATFWCMVVESLNDLDGEP